MTATGVISADLGRYATANACARALLAQLLGREGLEALYSYPSADAMLEMLARTAYGPALLLSPRTAHGLGSRCIEVGTRITAWLSGAEAAFIQLYLLRYEMENLKLILRVVQQRCTPDAIPPYLQPLQQWTTIDPRALAALSDIRDLAARIEGSPYGRALSPLLQQAGAAGASGIERVVEIDYYERLWAAAAWLRRADRGRARDILGILFDVLNLTWIARYRDAWQLSREEILNYTLRQGRWVTAEIREALAASAPGVWLPLESTPYWRGFVDFDAAVPDAAIVHAWRILAIELDRGFRVYPFHIGVPLGVLLAHEIEIRDLQVLLAAKRLGFTREQAWERIVTCRP